MAAQVKEVVVNTDSIELEDFGPVTCETFLDGSAWRDESVVKLGSAAGREPAAHCDAIFTVASMVNVQEKTIKALGII